jgi:hypothetical protein
MDKMSLEVMCATMSERRTEMQQRKATANDEEK